MAEAPVKVVAGIDCEEYNGGALVVDAVAPAVFLAVADAVGETRGVAPTAGAVLFLDCSAVRLAVSSR